LSILFSNAFIELSKRPDALRFLAGQTVPDVLTPSFNLVGRE